MQVLKAFILSNKLTKHVKCVYIMKAKYPIVPSKAVKVINWLMMALSLRGPNNTFVNKFNCLIII